MEPSLFVKEEEDAYIVDAGCVHAAVPKNKNVILRDVTVDGRVQVTDAESGAAARRKKCERRLY